MKAVLLSVSLMLVTMTACGGAEEPLPVEQSDVPISIAETSVRRGSNTFSLKTATDATAVEVTVWMPSMGHGAPSEPRVVKEQDGSYRLEDVVFSMPGTWELKIKVTCPTRHGARSFQYDVQ